MEDSNAMEETAEMKDSAAELEKPVDAKKKAKKAKAETEEAQESKPKKKEKIIQAIGKRKKSVAIATLKKGTGNIFINSIPLSLYKPRYARMRIEEGLALAKDIEGGIDINVSVKGGGVFGQADAARIAICNAIAAFDKKMKDIFIRYDRSLIVPDARRTEPHKPSRSSAGPRRKKQQSKR